MKPIDYNTMTKEELIDLIKTQTQYMDQQTSRLEEIKAQYAAAQDEHSRVRANLLREQNERNNYFNMTQKLLDISAVLAERISNS